MASTQFVPDLLDFSINSLVLINEGTGASAVTCADAQQIPLANDSVDLVVTSPPYASNAIDYMRAHKFSLIWLGHKIDDLGQLRREYIGGEAITEIDYEHLPSLVAKVVENLAGVDTKKGQVLHRYYSEMTRVLAEIYRVLKPTKAAIVVVGNSIIRDQDTQVPECLAEIGRSVGLTVPAIGVRNLDRNRRMMPAGEQTDLQSQIQQRMHQEFILGFYKPSNTAEGN